MGTAESLTNRPSPPLGWSLLPMAVPALLMAVLHFSVAPAAFYDPPWLILTGNTLFVGVVSFAVAGIAWRNYTATGHVQVLLLGCAMLMFGIGSVAAAVVRGLPGGANLNVTIHNTGALAGGILHSVAALFLLAGLVSQAGPARRKLWLALGYGGAVLFMAALSVASYKGVIPPFFPQGAGPTPLRQQVLGSADLLFVFSFLIFMATYVRNREPFLYWYAGGLALTAISLTGFFIQHAVGSPVGWAGRFAQYLGGIYFLLSLAAAGRSAQQRGAPFDDVLTASLTVAEEKFRAAFANAAVGFAMTTPSGRYLDANPAYCALTGYSLAELRALEFPELIHSSDRAPNMERSRAMLAGEIPGFTAENRCVRKGGQPVWVRNSISLVRDPQGNPRWIVALTEDITERIQSENALRKSEEKYRSLFENMTEEVHFWQVVRDEHGQIKTWRLVDANPPTLRTWGNSLIGIQGKTADEIFGPGATEHYMPVVQKIMSEGAPYTFEDYFKNLDKYFRFTSVPMGEFFITTGTDISDIRKAELALRESEERLRFALRSAQAAAWQWNIQTNEQIWSPESYVLHGRDPKLGLPSYEDWLNCLHPDDRAHTGRASLDAVEKRTPEYRTEYRVVSPSGEVRWLAALGMVDYGRDGTPLYMSGINIDITTRKQAEAELRESEDRLRKLYAALNDGLALHEVVYGSNGQATDYRLLDVNPAFERITGIGRERAVGALASTLYDTGSPPYLDIYARVAETGEPASFEIDFEPMRKCFNISAFSPANGQFATVFADITERKRAEASIKRKRALLEGINRIYNEALSGRTREELGQVCLAVAEDITGSAFSFMGDINIAANRLDDLLVSERSWQHFTMKDPQFPGGQPPMGLKIQGIYGRVLADGKSLIANEPASHPDRIGTPGGHPQLKAFLGVRLQHLGKTVGMIGLGNREGGYRQEDLRAVEALAPAILEALHSKRAEKALRESEERERAKRHELETILTAIPAAVLLAEDKACTRITANAAGRALLRLPDEANASKSAPGAEAPANFEIFSVTGEALTPDKLPIQIAAASARRVEAHEVEVRFTDGERRSLLGNALPLFDPEGEVRGAVGAFLDITERKRREEQVQLLLGEVNHRSKNMLALVDAIAWQTAADDPQDFSKCFSDRIRSLAASQDLLVKSEWQGVEIVALMRSQLAHFQGLIGTRITLEGPALQLSASAAQSFGMAIHELSTNAGKYGALSNASGRVAVTWKVEACDGVDHRFVLSWTEQGGPPVAAATRRGFGHTVTVSMPRLELNANVELQYAPAGVSWCVACPAAKVLEDAKADRPRSART